MPIYTLRCRECGTETDIYRRIAEMDVGLPSCCATTMQRKVCAPFVVADIAAYRAVAIDEKTGKAPVIEGRREHREFLKRNGLVEAADISPKPREIRGDFDCRAELARATQQVLSQPGHMK